MPKPENVVRWTWSQVLIKADMGLFRGLRSFRIGFHWRFWQPLEAVDGIVYFGRFGECDAEELEDRHRQHCILRGTKEKDMGKQPEDTPIGTSPECLIRHVLLNLVSGVDKLNDAPVSAGTHFDAAISELAKATEWRPDDAELAAIVDDAIEHMAFYGK